MDSLLTDRSGEQRSGSLAQLVLFKMSWWLKRSVPQESGALEKETLLHLLDNLIEKVVEKLVRVLVNDALMTPRRCLFPSP